MLDLPLERIHPQAFQAARATHCAGEQDKFWEVHDWLFDNQRAIATVASKAAELGLEPEPFEECLESDRYADAVRRDMAEARKAGASGTPSFVLAKTDPEDPTKVTGISFLRGAQPFSAFQTQIDQALAAEE